MHQKHSKTASIRKESKPIVPYTMEAAVAASRRRRRGTAVASLRAEAGSSELAIATAPAPAPPAAVAARRNLVLARQKALTAIPLSFCASPFFLGKK